MLFRGATPGSVATITKYIRQVNIQINYALEATAFHLIYKMSDTICP
jgi:hypothetical protein